MNKAAVIAGGSILAFFTGRYFLRLGSLSSNIVVDQVTRVSILEKDPLLNLIPTKIKISVDVTIKNPTKASVNIKYPFVQVFLIKDDPKGPLTSSENINKDFRIPQFGQVTLDTISIPFSLKEAALQFPSILANASRTRKLGLYTKIITFIDNQIKTEKWDFKEIGL